jgi:hypothetical protein
MPARSLSSIRTLGGRRDKSVPSHKAYLRVSFLELERTRHGQEISATRVRLERMLERCREIDVEKAGILAAMGRPGAATIATPGAVRTLRNGRRQFAVSY